MTLWTDGGGKVRQALKPVHGAAKVAAWLAGVTSRPYEGVAFEDMTTTLVEANGGPAVLITGGGRTITLLTVDVDDSGRVTAIHTIANPDKLGQVSGGHAHPLS